MRSRRCSTSSATDCITCSPRSPIRAFRGHQRGGVGRGRIAQPIHGELSSGGAEVLPLISAHVNTGETAAGGHAAAPARYADVQRRARYIASDRTRQLSISSCTRISIPPSAPQVARDSCRCAQPACRGSSRRSVQSNGVELRAYISPAATPPGYYSYKWAEVLAADAFEAFEEAGVFDPARPPNRFPRFHLWRGAEAWTRWMPSYAIPRAATRRAAAAQTNRNRRVKPCRPR